jgi:S-DNA-T family DNA segregation ATPase FtsK/SpoIIIE
VLPIIATIFTITIYILFSTLFHSSSIVGAAGKVIGEGNIYLFGYVAYINFIFILFPLYEIYKNPTLLKEKDIYVGWGLLLVSILILQGIFLQDDGGVISGALYSALSPNIGNAGLLFIFLLTATLSYTIINKDGIYNILEILKDNFITRFFRDMKENLFGLRPKKAENDIKDIVIPKRVRASKKEEIKQPKPKKLPKKEATKKSETKTKTKTKDTLVKDSTKDLQNSSIIVEELEENAKLLEDIELGKLEKPKNFKLPSLNFLQTPPKSVQKVNEAEIDRKIGELLEKLRLFKIDGDVVRTYTGPLVTTFEFKPAPHVKVSKILNLQDDLAMALSAETIRIQAPIPGRDVVGIEIPNDEFQTIYLKEILESKIFKNSKSPLTVALGKDIVGKPFVTDLQKLPHLLIAGTTGSGKSVGINAMILSLLYRNSPDDLKLILIDPKMLEFSIYNDIPHLLTPVIIEPKKAVIALANLVSEMERRYKLMAQEKVKNIDNYNQKAKKMSLEKLPFIVVIIDELADLMMTAGKEVEYSIGRLAQMARAAGIHIIVATQRPSVDVVTGLIKANLPARLSYRVGQKIDSKVILDAMGADALLGRGDALFTPPGITGLVRLHAPWNTEEEIEDIVEFLKAQQEPDYDESYLRAAGDSGDDIDVGALDLDPLFEKAKEVVLTDRKSSISYLQRKLQIGYNRSANIVEQLEKMGVLSEPNAKGNREILL